MNKILLVLVILLSGCGNEIANRSSSSSEQNVTNNVSNSQQASESDNPDCSNSPNGIDGSEGFLWKPESESDGKLVILFPAKFAQAFTKVCAYKLTGELECGKFSGFTNGSRQTWRFTEIGNAYSGDIEVLNGNKTCIWQVPNPAERND